MSLSLQHKIALLPPGRRRQWMAKLELAARQSIVMGIAWWFVGRPEQQTPPGVWRYWLILAGRGFGKTRTGAEWVAEKARRYPGCRIALVAPTFGDGRDTMVEGDALALDTLVPTPSGYATMGALRAGDVIIGGDGNPCTVTAAYAVAHDRPCYRVRLKGGVEVIADANHKWLTEDAATRAYTRRHDSTCRKPEVRTTAEIAATLRHYSGAASQANHGIRVTETRYTGVAGRIDPYTLGAWLGDGTAKNGAITTADPEMLPHFVAAGYGVSAQADNGTHGRARTYGVLGLQRQLRKAGLIRNKHVPMSYLRADRATRLAVLQGLMDTDGYVSARGQCEFVNKNRELAEAVVDLAAGLGIKASAPRSKLTRLGTTHWVVKFTTTVPVFRLSRKLARLPHAYRDAEHWYVLDAVPVPSVPVRCVSVDSPDRTFLITRHHIRTHNSGLLSVLHPSELRGGTVQKAWNRSLGELFMANGSHFKIFSSEVPKRLRGPQHHFAWGDEPAYWDDVEAGTAKDSTFSNLNFGLRLRGKPGWVGYRPQAVLTTTPRRVPLLKMPEEVVAERPALAGIMQRPDTVITRGRTMDNIANLDDTYRAAVIDPLVGTTLGQQELEGIMLEDVQGALWTAALLTENRIKRADMPRLNRIEIGFDPSGGTGYGHDEHGIIVAGSAGTRSTAHLYVLDDRSGRMTVNDAARRAIFAYLEYGAAAIVYEKNQGQDWIPATFKAEWEVLTLGVGAAEALLPEYAGQPMPHMEEVSAYKNKAERATPVAGLYQQHRAHHVGTFPILENQLTTWVPEDSLDSPDRMDALVWVLTNLYAEGPGTADVASSARRESRRRGRRTGMPSSRMPAVYDPRRSGR